MIITGLFESLFFSLDRPKVRLPRFLRQRYVASVGAKINLTIPFTVSWRWQNLTVNAQWIKLHNSSKFTVWFLFLPPPPGQTQTCGHLDKGWAAPGHEEGEHPQHRERQHPVHPFIRERRLWSVWDVCEGGGLRGQGFTHPSNCWWGRTIDVSKWRILFWKIILVRWDLKVLLDT